ncbi:MAG TPA: hypothetical protein VD758_08060, partial [Gemmatimonadaceae bacterium]|nr:hypothetical protein [Gemmatimonadaceae bacterium]
MGSVLRDENDVTAPQHVVRERRLRFSTPIQGTGKFTYQTGSSTDSVRPWMHPSPVIVQHRAQAVERARVAESLVRIAVLMVADMLILFVAHAIVDFARTSTAFGGALAEFLSNLIPRGSFPRVEVLTAVIIGLAVFGNYRGKSAWHNVINLLAGSSLGLSLVFWSRIWTDITLVRVLGFVVVLTAVVVALSSGRHILHWLVERVRPTPLRVSRAVILGSRRRAQDLERNEAVRLNQHLEVVGHVTLDGQTSEGSLGSLSDLVWILERHDVDSIIIADPIDEDALVDVLEVSDRTGCAVLLGAPMFPVAGFVPRV